MSVSTSSFTDSFELESSRLNQNIVKKRMRSDNSSLSSSSVPHLKAITTSFTASILNYLIDKQVKERTADLDSRICYLQGMVDSLTHKVLQLEDAADHQEQYSRRHLVRIYNKWKEKRHEDTESIVAKMTQDALNINITPEDIDRSHRVGPRKKNKSPRPIIVNSNLIE